MARSEWHDLEHRCGFCGAKCDKRVDIGITSGHGKQATEGIPDSCVCSFGYPFSLGSALKSSKRTPCTNRPIRCKICKCVFWSYNILIHYALQHSHLTCEEKCFPTQEEILAIKASKF